MTNKQIFGSALRQPWALVAFGSNSPVGRRPGTTVAYLTDDEGDSYLGGLVEFYRRRDEPCASWHFRFSRAKRIPKSEVFHIFRSTNKSRFGGPSAEEIGAARKALPVTAAPAIEAAA